MTKQFLQNWHEAINRKDPLLLLPLIADEAALYSPAYFRPKKGKDALMAVFLAVLSVVENFRYKGEWVEGNEILLLFEGEVEGKTVRGIDRIALNEDGILSEIEVFVRPLSGLSALAEKMSEKLT